MDYLPTLRDSISTSLKLKIFSTKKQAENAHLYNSKLINFPISNCKNNLKNFDSNRLKKTAIKAYPLTNRPRGMDDIKSVKFNQKQIKNKNNIIPVWIVETKKNNYVLLDGAHRIVAHYIETKKHILAYIIKKGSF